MSEINFLPVLLGSDINAYSMARAFHEEYGIQSIMAARDRSGITGKGLTNLFIYVENKKLDETDEFLKTLQEIMDEYGKEKQLLLIGCADHYVRLIVENKTLLKSAGFVVPYSDKQVLDNITLKENFYYLCDKYKVEFPTTFIYKPWMNYEVDYNFPYPMVVKASDSVAYHKNKFEGFQKAFFVNNKEELIKTLKLIYANGYDGNMILQEMIPGPDSNEYDLQMYFGSDHKAKLLNLGNVLLEEHTPTAIGNNAATMTVFDKDLMLSVAYMLEVIGYEGFADADIKLDPRDGIYKIFEINIRQGRSNYRVTGGGHNLAKLVVDDYIYHKPLEQVLVDEPFFWHVVPIGLVYTFVQDKKKVAQVRKLVASGKVCSSTEYSEDMPFMRWVYLKLRALNFYKKFLRYYPR
ncbi:MAG: hypothetical protein Q4E99_02070 [Bacillota bacterium]|nr:hypothetical protein [Bacillota bacterium]